MKESEKIIYVPLFSNVDVTPIIEESMAELPDPDPTADAGERPAVGLVTTAQHMNTFGKMRAWLQQRGFDVETRRGDERLTHEGQVLGCNYASADVDADHILYVGGGKFHPLGLAMEHPDKTVVIADPVNNVVTVADTEKFMKQRYAAVHKAMDAEEWGVIFCTKIGQGRWETAQEIVAENDDAYLITMDEVTPDRLTNFGLDAYVNTGCPRITTDDGPQFKRPMLTPGEYRIAIGEEPLEALEFDTFHGTW
jgi:2-(3-amino-3-carboxypropyl)histidine synthase